MNPLFMVYGLKKVFSQKLPIFFLFFLIFLLFNRPAFAQTSTASAELSFETISQSNLYTNESPHYASMAIYNFAHAFSCILIGQSPIAPCLEYKVVQDAQGSIRSIPILSQVKTNGGLLGAANSVLVAMYDNPPLRSSEFIAGVGKDLGLVKEAHAQVGGSGNAVLSPIYKLWEVSRNIAYLCMIIVFVAVGVMVMFRQRLNPQTVISIQLALPGLIIGLVLITFSYFLSSLIVDTAFLGTDLVGYYFQSAQTAPNSVPSLTQMTSSENFISIMSRLTSAMGSFNISSGVNTLFNNLSGTPNNYVRAAITFLSYQYGGQAGAAALGPIGGLVGLIRGGFGVAGAGATIGSIVGNLGAGGLAAIVGSLSPSTVINIIVSFVMTIMLVITIFRLIFKLLNNFLSIIFYTLASPFIFLFSALPGRQGLVNNWVRNMLCNVLAFPAVAAVLYFCYFLLTGGKPLEPGNQLFIVSSITPVDVTNEYATLPLFGGLDLNVINVLLAFGAFLATPAIPDIVCKSIGKIGPAGGMIENQITAVQRSGQGYAQRASAAPGQLSKDIGRVKELANEKSLEPVTGEWKVTRIGAFNVFKSGRTGPPPQ